MPLRKEKKDNFYVTFELLIKTFEARRDINVFACKPTSVN